MSEKAKRALIWGSKETAKYYYEELKNIDSIVVVGFADNAIENTNRKLFGLPVIGISQLKTIEFDIIIIASYTFHKSIYEQLIEVITCPIYESMEELVGRRFSIDISGWCNAKCKWCCTGRKNREAVADRKYMTVEEFKRVYNHLVKINLLYKFNEILLYSWGEPFLNPDYKEIISFLHEKKQKFSISTNASVPQYMNECTNYYEYCDTVVFSMSGYSQDSYDKIHGFNFNSIVRNIEKIIQNMRNCGFKGKAKISYHVYKFNRMELKDAKKFAEKLQIELEPINAYFASFELQRKYLETGFVDGALKELNLEKVRDLIQCRPINYKCLVENVISIHWNGKVELCCCADEDAKNFLWDNIEDIESLKDWKAYRKKMLQCDTCTICRKLGIDYWMFNNPKYMEE